MLFSLPPNKWKFYFLRTNFEQVRCGLKICATQNCAVCFIINRRPNKLYELARSRFFIPMCSARPFLFSLLLVWRRISGRYRKLLYQINFTRERVKRANSLFRFHHFFRQHFFNAYTFYKLRHLFNKNVLYNCENSFYIVRIYIYIYIYIYI